MEFETFTQPVTIICGAHGGGTSYVTKMMRFCGFFAGHDAGDIRSRKFHESRLFKSINYQIGSAVGDREIFSLKSLQAVQMTLESNIESWKVRAEREVREGSGGFGRPNLSSGAATTLKLTTQLANRIDPFSRRTWPGYVTWRYRLVSRDAPWGWKDPRNGATLPLWREIFPGARVLLIHKETDQAQSKSPSGAWFRQTDNVECADLLQNPPDAAEFDDVMSIRFEEVTREVDAYNRLLDWLGLPLLTKRQFAGLLSVTGFEGP